MKSLSRLIAATVLCFASGAVCAADPETIEALMSDVEAAEQAFADAFAARDLELFASFIHPDAVFAGRDGPLQGKAAVLEVWSRYFESAEPPFSWAPRRVLVSPDGTMASTTGPVWDAEGRWVAAFASTWIKQPDGKWQVVLDTSPSCPPPESHEDTGEAESGQ